MIICEERILATITETLSIINHSAVFYLFSNDQYVDYKTIDELVNGYENETSNFV